MANGPNRREFCRQMATSTGWAIASSRGLADEFWSNSFEDSGPSLLTNPKYGVGAKLRLAQFIRRGTDPTEAEAIFRRLPDLDAQRWVDEWTKLAAPCEAQGAGLAAQGNHEKAK